MHEKGFGALSKHLEEAQSAFACLDGDLLNVSFDPNDPASIQQAIQAMCSCIDERVRRYSHNSTVASLAAGMKESYRSAIVSKATALRLGGDRT